MFYLLIILKVPKSKSRVNLDKLTDKLMFLMCNMENGEKEMMKGAVFMSVGMI